ncbi:hypothetical protein FQA39_LY01187 [Lamprigera yunnana]|nr:hypothetical protein FQA39_LY01187 [Lamprigera yunnana]
MSTFNGKIVEIPQISVDRFNLDNKKSLVYFLSHCHTDHMEGLGDFTFQTRLVETPDVYLYASSISIQILKNKYSDKNKFANIENKLKPLPIINSTLIKIPQTDESFTVSLLPAGHCPGSVMFLFETKDKNILYTDTLKKIDKMYLDTTFFDSSYATLPSREETLKIILKAIKEWIDKDSNNLINIIPNATYGCEYILWEVSNKMGMPIHVNKTCCDLYRGIPEMDGVFTLNGRKTKIHSNCGPRFKQICNKNYDSMRNIALSTIWWKGKDMNSMYIDECDNKVRICYSFHASFEEIKEFILFLKPFEVEPCVVPDDEKHKRRMMKLLQQVISSYKNNIEEVRVKLFDEECSPKNDVVDGDDTINALLQSPTSCFKRKRSWLND